MTEKIAIIGLGYVGLPLGVALSAYFDGIIGLDIDEDRIQALNAGHDITGEVSEANLKNAAITFSTQTHNIAGASFYIVTVPTPVDADRRPDLTAVKSACRTVGKSLSKGAVVVFESTVYPGVTEDICGPILEEVSGLECGVDFTLGYSPERINPGDKVNTIDKIVKVIGAQDEATLARMRDVYGSIITAGLHEAPNIKVAEAAKVIENTQRDVNIALMNELALIFNRMNIRTKDVLDAAATKWNFLPFTPGLVGGHCIGVDPYYLTSEAERAGHHPKMILTARRVNEGMGHFVAKETIAMMIKNDLPIRMSRIGILGLSFKENVPDLRNSRVPDIIETLRSFGLDPMVHDPFVDKEEAKQRYNVDLVEWDEMNDLHALIYTVPHAWYGDKDTVGRLVDGGIMMDVKSQFKPDDLPDHLKYWSL